MTWSAGPVAFAAGPALSFLLPMSKARNILGVITGVVLIFSSAAHSFLGWKSMRAQLVGFNAPPELITGVFGLRLRGQEGPLWVPRLIGLCYTIAGVVAYQVSKENFFLSVFVVP